MRDIDPIPSPNVRRQRSRIGSITGRRWWPLVCLLLFIDPSLHAQSGSKEHQLKAAFLFNFTKFVEWDKGSFSSPDAALVIGVLGSTAFGNEVERAVDGRKVNGRALVVRKLRSATESRSVHLLFISAEEDGTVSGIINSVRGAPVLTVGESPVFSRAGGAITFVIEGGKVRFDINTTAAERASVRISSQLQKLARSVNR
jgi:hypothetical protein